MPHPSEAASTASAIIAAPLAPTAHARPVLERETSAVAVSSKPDARCDSSQVSTARALRPVRTADLRGFLAIVARFDAIAPAAIATEWAHRSARNVDTCALLIEAIVAGIAMDSLDHVAREIVDAVNGLRAEHTEYVGAVNQIAEG